MIIACKARFQVSLLNALSGLISDRSFLKFHQCNCCKGLCICSVVLVYIHYQSLWFWNDNWWMHEKYHIVCVQLEEGGGVMGMRERDKERDLVHVYAQ